MILQSFQLDFYDLAVILSSVFTVYVAKKFFSIFVAKSRNHILTNVAYIAYGIMTTLYFLLIDIPIVNLVISVVFLSIIGFTYQISCKKALLLTISYCGVLWIAELLVNADIFGLFLSKFGIFLTVLLLQNVKLYRENNALPLAYLLESLLTPTLSIVIGVMMMQIGIEPVALISMAILMLINIFAFILFDQTSVYYEKQYETARLQQENRYYHNQLKSMEQSVNATRSFRHDIQNHFNMIEGFLKANKTDEALIYLQKLRESDRLSEESFVSTGNFVIDSVLNYKLSVIQDLDVNTELDISVPPTLKIDTVHFVSILTNLLDNAIEALNAMDDAAHKTLRIRIAYNKGRLFILIQNSYAGDLIYEDGAICSSKPDANNHGYGFENVKRAIEPYNGLLKINHNEGIFSVQVLLYVEST